MRFPERRMRRLRLDAAVRRLVRETSLSAANLICPLFVTGERDVRRPLGAIAGVDLLSGVELAAEARRLAELGIAAVLLFGVLEDGQKDAAGSTSCSAEGPVQRAIREIRNATPDLTVIADLCLCEYTTDGHCGLLSAGAIDNDRTLDALAGAAVSLAQAGAGIIAPSGMMDGVVRTLRTALDQNGHKDVLVMPYSAKFASPLYGPFKSATRSAPRESHHATHQLDPGNGRQAMEEIRLDIEEGADIVIVKPALGYLDIVTQARRRFDVPIAAYQVSGEYNMLEMLGQNDPDYRARLMWESLLSIRRAGSDMIITYFAPEAARRLREGKGP